MYVYFYVCAKLFLLLLIDVYLSRSCCFLFLKNKFFNDGSKGMVVQSLSRGDVFLSIFSIYPLSGKG